MIPKEDPNSKDVSLQQAVFSSSRMKTETTETSNIKRDELGRYMIHVQKYVHEFNDRFPFATICLLDCCRFYCFRDTSLAKITARHPGEIDDQRTIVNAGFLIGFACAPGSIADDKEEGENGLFTKHLLKHIVEPDVDISKILHAVRGAVIEESQGRQKPSFVDELVTNEDICLCVKVPGMSLIFE